MWNSFEGYYQQWCRNGHVTNKDIGYRQDHTAGVCPICAESIVFRNFVEDDDPSNCDRVSLDQFKITPETTTKDFKCVDGVWEHITRTVFGTYRIPTNEEIKVLRQNNQNK
jgi:hypothetical protein